MTIARKISSALFVAVLVVLGVHSIIRLQRETELFDTDMRRDHRLIGTTLDDALHVAWRTGGPRAVRTLIEHADASKQGVHIRWVGSSDVEGPGKPRIPLSHLDDLADAGIAHRTLADAEAKQDMLVTYVPLPGIASDDTAIEIAESLAARSAYVQKTIENTIVVAVVLSLVCGGIAVAIGAWFIGRPVQDLIESARRIGEGDFENPVVLSQTDELGRLARALNAMSDRLAAARERVQRETAARIRALEQLRHADRLSTVGQIASAIAHELGTPLNVVAGHAKRIETARVRGSDAEHAARVIREQAERMTRLIRQVLEYARRGEVRKARHDVRALVGQAANLVAPLAEAKEVSIDTVAGVSKWADVDAAQIQQVLTNLLMNALQASPRGQVVSLTVETVEAARSPEEDPACWIRVGVENTGPGIAQEALERIFEPFFSTKPSGEGTGLGLSIVRDIVEEHGGFVRVESSPGRGARFDVYLPATGQP